MGCSQSKIENEEAVFRCKERKNFMKTAVLSRNAFAAAHVTYSMSLKNAGAALSDFAHGEVSHPNTHSLSSSTSAPPDLPAPQPPNLPPPPPPIPDLPPPPLQRAVSMPEFLVSKPGVGRAVSAEETIVEADEEEEEEEEEEEGFRRKGRIGNSHSVDEEEGFRGRMVNSHSGVEGVRDAPPPPMPETGDPTWDYFFNVEVPGGSLGDVDYMSKRAVNNPTISETVVVNVEEKQENLEYMVKRGVNNPTISETVVVNVEEKEESVEYMVKRGVNNPSRSETFVVDEEGESVMVGGGERPSMGRVLKKGKAVASGSGNEEGKRRNVNLVGVFGELDDCFLKAYQSAHEVSKMLEAARLHFHSNFADNSGIMFKFRLCFVLSPSLVCF